MIAAKIVADSISEKGARITTWDLTYPRFILAEVNTHRMCARGSASSRAIPIAKILESVEKDPAMPIHYGANQAGMQARSVLSKEDEQWAKDIILDLRDKAVDAAKMLAEVGLHKQVANRYLEPWFHMRTVLTTTTVANLLSLRVHEDAQPEFAELGEKMLSSLENSDPFQVGKYGWHLPFVSLQEQGALKEAGYSTQTIAWISAARCGAVSYVNHNNRKDWDAEVERARGFMRSGHGGPLEHACSAHDLPHWEGPFYGWKQLRKFSEGERVFPNSPVHERILKLAGYRNELLGGYR